MSANPDFVAQNDSNYTTVRFYTALDPYHYTTDNRPLQDLEANLKASRSVGSDAARRAALLGSMNLSAVLADLYAVGSTSSAARTMQGLKVNLPSTNLIRINPGAVYELRSVSTTVNDSVMKQVLLTKTIDFTLTPPVTVGTSIVYTIEGQFVELTTGTMATTGIPNLDPANALLPSTIIQGELKLSMIPGVAAATGSEVPATTTTGNFPLYNITLTQGVANPKVRAHANAPYMKSPTRSPMPIQLSTGYATLSVINEMQVTIFPDSITSGVILPVMGLVKELNPYLPLKLKLTFASSAASGNVAMKLRYKGYLSGEAYTTVGIDGAIDAIPVTGAINTIQTSDTTIAVVPNTEFADFVNGVWAINKEKLSVVLERLGSNAADTNTGTLTLFNVVLFQ